MFSGGGPGIIALPRCHRASGPAGRWDDSMLQVYCPKCRTILSVEAIQGGSLARCPACAQVFRVPFMPVLASPPAVAAPEPPPAPAQPEPAPVPQPATPRTPTPPRQGYNVESLEIMDDRRASETYDVVAELAPLPA